MFDFRSTGMTYACFIYIDLVLIVIFLFFYGCRTNILPETLFVCPNPILFEYRVNVGVINFVKLIVLVFFYFTIAFDHAELLNFIVSPSVQKALFADSCSMIRAESKVAHCYIWLMSNTTIREA